MLVIVTGPTGSGKTSVALRLQERYGWHLIKTLTTRPARGSGADTKTRLGPRRAEAIKASPSEYRIFQYENHLYATPLRPVRSAARSLKPIAVIDWVHPHPEDLSVFGEHIVATVLLPSIAELTRRLERASRSNRLPLALNEREHIVASRNYYASPWTVVESDAGIDDIADLVRNLVRTAEAASAALG